MRANRVRCLSLARASIPGLPVPASGNWAVFFPLGEIIPRRTTPEVRFLFAELGATMPYREASRVLRTCGFGRMRASHAADAMVVGIDATYVRHRERLASRQIQITAGRLERNGALGARFAFVSSARAGTSGSSTDS
jgi:hypothetical protein